MFGGLLNECMFKCSKGPSMRSCGWKQTPSGVAVWSFRAATIGSQSSVFVWLAVRLRLPHLSVCLGPSAVCSGFSTSRLFAGFVCIMPYVRIVPYVRIMPYVP